jgi:hypothetical protein
MAHSMFQKTLKNRGFQAVIINMNNFLNEYQISKIFNINPVTLKKLIQAGKIPFTNTGKHPCFDMNAISDWVVHNPIIEEDEDARLKKYRQYGRRNPLNFLPPCGPWT